MVTVIAFLLAMAAPNLFSLMQASELGSQGQIFKSRLSLAQQQALSTNADVEVRIYRYANAADDQEEERYRAMQFYQYNDLGKLEPISEIFKLENPLIFSDDPQLSNLLADPNVDEGLIGGDNFTVADVSAKKIFGSGVDRVSFKSFRFRPDGSTSLVAAPAQGGSDAADIQASIWYITIVEGQFSGGSNVPTNYYTVQIDPFNGSLRDYRP